MIAAAAPRLHREIQASTGAGILLRVGTVLASKADLHARFQLSNCFDMMITFAYRVSMCT
jgi:hypothetical protein